MNEDERIAVVDKQNNVLGYKLRGDLTDDDCWRTVCVWIENSRSEILLQKRTLDRKVNPGLWTNAVIGTVVGDDSYDITAERETQEEIGLSGITLIETNSKYYKASFGWRFSRGYVGKCDWTIKQFTPQTEEVAQLEWVDKQQVIDEITGKLPPSRAYTNAYRYWTELFNLV